MQEGINEVIKLFEIKVNLLEERYKERHPEDFDKRKMDRYVNRKLKRERQALILMNVAPTANILNSTERLKY